VISVNYGKPQALVTSIWTVTPLLSNTWLERLFARNREIRNPSIGATQVILDAMPSVPTLLHRTLPDHIPMLFSSMDKDTPKIAFAIRFATMRGRWT
jgi:hypothetical protein